MGMEEIEKQFGVTSTSEFEDQISERKLPEMAFVINEDGDKYAEIIASPLPILLDSLTLAFSIVTVPSSVRRLSA